MEADVIVIGGGMAGTTAALKAASLGADVILIRKGQGSTAMSSGTIDIAGPEKFLPLDSWGEVPRVSDRLKEILRVNPLHPYSIVAGGRSGIDLLCEQLSQATEFLLHKIPRFQMYGSCDQNIALPTVLGTAKFSSFAARSLSEGNLCAMRDAQVLLVGISGLMLFQPRICRQTLARYSSLHPPRPVERVEIIEAIIPHSMNALPSAPFEIARYLDEPQAAGHFAKVVRANMPAGINHVALPPVLGLDNHEETFDIFSREIGKKVFELISPTFSVPGYRLQRALESSLRENRVRILNDEVLDAKREGRKIRNLILKGRKSKRTAAAENYVLAAGKFNSGGILTNDFPIEPIFDLPLFCKDNRADARFMQDLLNWTVEGKQLLFSCGIHIDGQLRPLSPFGEPVYENLYAAGSIIGEYDYVADKCGLGVAILTGYIAGVQAAAKGARP
ncbi:MAG: FAD-binding protein [Candidatus Abyssobacteria bacterium SURF_5]|uniref:FAD-binding protein n=1 Tax=Abyssobacteria bacterium (strain SURF_5) TaxID=2093360 RepID=A0A3A4NBF4_ABYX5|nr:MAG: FAD-binding protein [Candidatus Abyssubacteria bacterium SURF_5]